MRKRFKSAVFDLCAIRYALQRIRASVSVLACFSLASAFATIASPEPSNQFHRVVEFVVTSQIKMIEIEFAMLAPSKEGSADAADLLTLIARKPVAVYSAVGFPSPNAPPLLVGSTDATGHFIVDARLLPTGSYIAVCDVQVLESAGSPVPLGRVSSTPVADADRTIPDPAKDLAIEHIYYATDRQRMGDNPITYGSDRSRADSLEFGSCEVSIPREHRMGSFESATILRFEFSNARGRDVALIGIRSEDKDAFYKDIEHDSIDAQRASPKLPSGDTLVFIHGFNTSFEDAVRRTAQLKYDLGFDGPAVVYSWPSKSELIPNPVNYTSDTAAATWTTSHLVSFLRDLAKASGVRHMHIIAHSMGNQPLTNALAILAQSGSSDKFKDVILAAPDVDEGVFSHLAKNVASVSNELTIYASAHDRALQLSSLLSQYSRLGFDSSPHFLASSIVTIDATSVDTSLVGHSYFGDQRTLVTDLFYLVRGFLPPRAGMSQLSQSFFQFKP